jgi:hypothetical protein
MKLPFKKTHQEDEFIPFPDIPPKTNKENPTKILIALIIVLPLTAFTYYSLLKPGNISLSDPHFSRYDSPSLQNSSSQQVKAAPTPTPKPLPTGKQVYRFSHGSEVIGPKPTTVTIDPIDPQIKSEQILLVEVSHISPINKVTAILKTDNDEKTMPLKIYQGSNLDGTWMVGWKTEDAYLHTYIIDIISEAKNGDTNTSTLTFR